MNLADTVTLESRIDYAPKNLWLRNKSWDLMFISLSAILVPLPFVIFWAMNHAAPFMNSILGAAGVSFSWDTDASRNLINGLIALFIGGPHMYATYSRTVLDRQFSRKHQVFLGLSLLIPVMVIYLGIAHFQLLITVFFFWASIHILHQMAYIMDCYTARANTHVFRLSNLVDYAVVFSSLYPIATYKFIHDTFFIGGNKILFPEFLKSDVVFYLITAIFAVSVVLFIWKTIREVREGTAHYPKILLISLTTIIAFLLPAADNLDVAFQGFNAWHSFQYLGLTIYINHLRHDRGEIGTKFVDRLSTEGKSWNFYFFNVGLTVMAVAVISLLVYFTPVLGLSFDQCYYIVVLSFLLVHYLHDHLLFTDIGAVAGT
jgi:hypothetical protein